VAAGKEPHLPWEGLEHPIYLGSETVVEAMQRAQPGDTDLSAIPAAKKRPRRSRRALR
jgi:hypothetical protein